MTPHVSVVMPARNGARWLGEAVESVISQSFPDWELLAIDDGSTDDTPRLLTGFAGRDSRIRVIRQDASGLVAALNRGLAAARGSLLARLDADDRAAPTRLQRQVQYLASHSDVGLLGSWAQEIDDQGRMLGQRKPETRPDELSRLLLRSNPLVHSSVMLRTGLARSLGGYRAAFRAAEDYDLWLRIAEVAKPANLPEMLVQYRWHSENVSKRDALRQSFSVRLAQCSALARRETGTDPADGLMSPPDWRAPHHDAFYADDAVIYRLLDLADPDFVPHAGGDADFAPLASRFAELNHAERRLAALAMINHMTRAERRRARQTRRLFLRLLSRSPGMVPRAAWSLLPAALLR